MVFDISESEPSTLTRVALYCHEVTSHVFHAHVRFSQFPESPGVHVGSIRRFAATAAVVHCLYSTTGPVIVPGSIALLSSTPSILWGRPAPVQRESRCTGRTSLDRRCIRLLKTGATGSARNLGAPPGCWCWCGEGVLGCRTISCPPTAVSQHFSLPVQIYVNFARRVRERDSQGVAAPSPAPHHTRQLAPARGELRTRKMPTWSFSLTSKYDEYGRRT